MQREQSDLPRWFKQKGQLHQIVRRRPLGLVTDVDGTISPIAPTPEAAEVTPGCRRRLRQLAEHLAVVAVISGRAAADAHRMVGLDEIVYVGNHGLERWEGGRLHVAAAARESRASLQRALQRARRDITHEGVRLEDKGVTASIHYRLASQPQEAREHILAVIQPLIREANLRLTEGRYVLEIRPQVEADKGSALRSLIEDEGLRGAFYLGDDTTDVDAFRVLHDLRNQGQVQGKALGVLGDETPDGVVEHGDLFIDGVGGVEDFLAWLVHAGRSPAS